SGATVATGGFDGTSLPRSGCGRHTLASSSRSPVSWARRNELTAAAIGAGTVMVGSSDRSRSLFVERERQLVGLHDRLRLRARLDLDADLRRGTEHEEQLDELVLVHGPRAVVEEQLRLARLRRLIAEARGHHRLEA